jgi:hypothetical protein
VLRFRFGGAEDTAHGLDEAAPFAGLLDKVCLAGLGQFVEAGLAIVFGRSPPGFDPALFFEALECGVERAVIDEQDVFGLLLDAASDTLAVLWPEEESTEDENVKCALEERDSSGRHATGSIKAFG